MVETKSLIVVPKNAFFRVKCPSCSNEQIIYSAASTKVKCLVCNHVLAESGASKIKLKTELLKVLE